MSKKLRRDPIYIAPEISGWIDEHYVPHVIDERNNSSLNPMKVEDKIIVYERQVTEWFLNPALSLIKTKNKAFVVLMICLSYLEGVEQYRKGERSDRKSRSFFVSSLQRIYPKKYSENQLKNFYIQARCGLFHTGMVQGKLVVNNSFAQSIEFVDDFDIKISPKKLLDDIINDFKNYIEELKNNRQSAIRFSSLYSNI